MSQINTEAHKILANLMTAENLTVVHTVGEPPHFDTANRILTIPLLEEDVHKDVYNLFIGSEIGYALHTPPRKSGLLESGVPDKYIDVIEGARVTRAVQKDYMGLTAMFSRGNDELLSRGFYGVDEDTDLSMLHLMDRINLYSKFGSRAGDIYFSDEEMVLRDKALSVSSWKESLEVGKEILDFLNEPPQERQSQESEGKGKGDEGEESDDQNKGKGKGESNPDDKDDSGEGEGKGDEGEESDDQNKGKGKGKGKPQDGDQDDQGGDRNDDQDGDQDGDQDDQDGDGEGDEPEDQPENAPDVTDSSGGTAGQREQDGEKKDTQVPTGQPTDPNAMVTTQRDYSTVSDKSSCGLARTSRKQAPIVSNKEYANEMRAIVKLCDTKTSHELPKIEQKIGDFIKSRKPYIQAMVSQFEMKKAAHAQKRTQITRTGKLDPLQLSNYRFSENLFKNGMIVNNEKNHGLVILLDNSSSMNGTIQALCKEIYTLAEFCRRVDIPLEVYHFTDGYGSYGSPQATPKDVRYGGAKVIQIMDSKAPKSDYEVSRRALILRSLDYDTRYVSYIVSHQLNRMHCTPLVESYIALYMIVRDFKDKYDVEIMNTMILTDGMGNGSICTGETSHSGGRTRNEQSLLFEWVGYDVHKLQHHTDRTQYMDGYEISILEEIQKYSKVIGYFIGGTHLARGMSSEELKTSFEMKGYVEINRKGHDQYFLLPHNMTYNTNKSLSVVENSVAKAASRSMVKRLAKELSTK